MSAVLSDFIGQTINWMGFRFYIYTTLAGSDCKQQTRWTQRDAFFILFDGTLTAVPARRRNGRSTLSLLLRDDSRHIPTTTTKS